MVRSILMPTKPPPWGRKTTHTTKANRNPIPQRVIHPTNRTPASSSLANFRVQQASRIKRSIFATLVVTREATTDTKFSKASRCKSFDLGTRWKSTRFRGSRDWGGLDDDRQPLPQPKNSTSVPSLLEVREMQGNPF